MQWTKMMHNRLNLPPEYIHDEKDKLLEIAFSSFSYQFTHKIHSSCSGTVQIFNDIYVPQKQYYK
jgi:hypothetical protein